MADLKLSRRLRLLASPLALASSAACAQPVAVESGNEAVDRFVRDIESGRSDAASQIASIESLTGEPNAADTPDAFVAKLLTCDFVSVHMRRFGSDLYDVRWHCPDGDYFSMLDPYYRPPRLTVGEFLSAATREARNHRPPPPPPAPPAPPVVKR